MKAKWQFWKNPFIATIITDNPDLTNPIKMKSGELAPTATPIQQNLAKSLFDLSHKGQHIQRINFCTDGIDLILKGRRDEKVENWRYLKLAIEQVFTKHCGVVIEN